MCKLVTQLVNRKNWEPATKVRKTSNQLVYLQTWSGDTECWDRSMQTGEDRIDCGKNCATVAAGNENIGDRSNDANVGLLPDTLENLFKRDTHVVEDLRILHGWAGCNVQCRHVPADIGITHDGENPAYGHRNEMPELI